MNKRKYKTNPEELSAMGRTIAKQGGNDVKSQHRVETVNLVLSGHSATELIFILTFLWGIFNFLRKNLLKKLGLWYKIGQERLHIEVSF